MLSCVGNGPHSHRHPRGSAREPVREGRSWEALPEGQHGQSQPPGCPGARHTSSAPGVVPALLGWAGLCCLHPPQCPGSTSCTHRPRESRHPKILSALPAPQLLPATLTKPPPRGLMHSHPPSSPRSWHTLEVGFWVPLCCSITQAYSTSAWHGLVGPPVHTTGSECKVLCPKGPLQTSQIPH